MAIVEVPGDFEITMSVLSLSVVDCLLEFVFAVFWGFCLGQMSCKSILKLQVVIISLGAFQVFCEARVNTRSPLIII